MYRRYVNHLYPFNLFREYIFYAWVEGMCIFKCTGLVFVMKVSEIIVYSCIDFNVQFKVNTKPKELLMGIECLLSIFFHCFMDRIHSRPYTEKEKNVGHMVMII